MSFTFRSLVLFIKIITKLLLLRPFGYLSITKGIREVNHTFEHYLLPGVGSLIILENVKIPTLCPTPRPPSGLILISFFDS